MTSGPVITFCHSFLLHLSSSDSAVTLVLQKHVRHVRGVALTLLKRQMQTRLLLPHLTSPHLSLACLLSLQPKRTIKLERSLAHPTNHQEIEKVGRTGPVALSPAQHVEAG